MDFLEYIFLNNKVYLWLLALVTALVIFIVLAYGRNFAIQKLLARTNDQTKGTKIFLLGALQRTRLSFLLVIAIYVGLLFLVPPGNFREGLRTTMIIISLIQVGFWGTGVINFLIDRKIRYELDRNNTNATTLGGLGLVARVAFWAMLILVILDNLPGVEVSALIASLGITGVAVALAVQNILGDLFASLSITLDKPFVIGDFVTVGDMSGSVEYIGLKSTRIRSISGEQLIFSNSDLLNSRIRNFKRMDRRRVAFDIGVAYFTPVEKLQRIPQILKDAITRHPPEEVSFDRAHFKSFGDAALLFEVVYFIENPDYLLFMNIQQQINLEILQQFNREGIEFAYPVPISAIRLQAS